MYIINVRKNSRGSWNLLLFLICCHHRLYASWLIVILVQCCSRHVAVMHVSVWYYGHVTHDRSLWQLILQMQRTSQCHQIVISLSGAERDSSLVVDPRNVTEDIVWIDNQCARTHSLTHFCTTHTLLIKRHQEEWLGFLLRNRYRTNRNDSNSGIITSF